MKRTTIIPTIGTITIFFGVIFHFQGQAIIGPESSFMYSNPKWITFGLQIEIFGLIVTGAGIGLFIIKKIRLQPDK